jgi:plastocyanin
MRYNRVCALFSAVAFLFGCGGSTSPMAVTTAPPSETATVSATPSIAFTPGTVALLVGGTLTINFGSVAHNVFFDNQPAGAPANITGANADVSKALTFSVAGTYVYNCHIHPGMHGTVVVTAPTT